MAMKPATRPVGTHFSSGPCAKRPGWTTDILKTAVLGRSHRAKDGKARLRPWIAERRRQVRRHLGLELAEEGPRLALGPQAQRAGLADRVDPQHAAAHGIVT